MEDRKQDERSRRRIIKGWIEKAGKKQTKNKTKLKELFREGGKEKKKSVGGRKRNEGGKRNGEK